MNRRGVVAALLWCSSALGWACSLIVDHDVVQCRTDRDCFDKGFTDSVCTDKLCRDPLHCVTGKAATPQLDVSRPKVMTRVRFINLSVTGGPVEGAEVRVCPQTQTSGACDSERNLGVAKTDSDGAIFVEVPYAFNGSFQILQAPPRLEAPGTFIPTVLFTRRFPTVSDPPDRPIPDTQSTRLATFEAVGFLLAIENVTLNPTQALVFGAVFDCNDRPLAGAKVTIDDLDPSAVPFYGTADGKPTRSQLETTVSGIYGFANIPAPEGGIARNVTIRAKRGDELWASANVEIKSGQLTTVGLRYAPSP